MTRLAAGGAAQVFEIPADVLADAKILLILAIVGLIGFVLYEMFPG